MRTLLKLALAVAAASAVVVLIHAQSLPSNVPATEEQKPKPAGNDPRFVVKITDEMIRHSRIEDALYFVSTAWSLGVLALLLFSGASRKMRDAAARATKRPFVASM